MGASITFVKGGFFLVDERVIWRGFHAFGWELVGFFSVNASKWLGCVGLERFGVWLY